MLLYQSVPYSLEEYRIHTGLDPCVGYAFNSVMCGQCTTSYLLSTDYRASPFLGQIQSILLCEWRLAT